MSNLSFQYSKAGRIVNIGLFSSMCIVSNYVMLPLWNIKLMDTIVFVCGFIFGLYTGLLIATISWIVYGSINPYGFSLPTLVVVIVGEMFYAISGDLLRRTPSIPNNVSLLSIHNLIFGVVGLVSTLAYDLLTNAFVGWLFYGSIIFGLLTMNFPIPMGIIHEVSNFFFFALLAPIIINSVHRIFPMNILKR
ncbi:MAG: hypothetical protein ACUVTL_08365 [Thermoproteota archaeon]